MGEKVMVITMPNCEQCDEAKKILKEKGIEIDELMHIEAYHDDYPIIYIDGKRLCYRDFLIEIKKR